VTAPIRTPGAARRAPRVLLVEGALRENGGLRVNHALVADWRAAGVPARLLVLENVPPDVPLFAPAPGVPWSFASARVRRFRTALPFVLAGLVRHARRADVVISGSEVGWQLLLGWLVARLFRLPFAVLVHAPLRQAIDDWQPARLRPALWWVHRHVDRAYCVSPGLVARIVANGLPADRVAVIPVGIDVEGVTHLGAAPLPAELAALGPVEEPGAARPPLLVAMGRLAPAKGFDVLVEASAILRDEGVPHRVVIAGDGPERARLAGRIAALGLQDVVRLVGFVRAPQPLLAAADLFVLPSRHEGNGSLVLLEALAHARPIVAADCETGPRYVLGDGDFGVLVPAEDPIALAKALAEHLGDPAPLARLAAAGPRRARDFDQAVASQVLLADLREHLGGPSVALPGRNAPLA